MYIGNLKPLEEIRISSNCRDLKISTKYRIRVYSIGNKKAIFSYEKEGLQFINLLDKNSSRIILNEEAKLKFRLNLTFTIDADLSINLIYNEKSIIQVVDFFNSKEFTVLEKEFFLMVLKLVLLEKVN